MKHFFFFVWFLLFLCYNLTEAQTNANIPGPENVLVVYNTRLDTSRLVKDYYVNARNIPSSNIAGLYLSDTTMTINSATHRVGLAQGTDNIRDFYNDSIGTWWPTFHAWRYYLDKIAIPIKNHLNDNNLTSTIRYIVLCKGVPFKVQASADSGGTPYGNVTVDGLLCMLNTTNYESFIGNTIYQYHQVKNNPSIMLTRTYYEL